MSKVGKQQLATDVQASLVPFAVATGVANAYNVLISGIASYYDGLSFKLKIPVAASAPVTVNVNGLGVIPVKKDNGNAVNNWKKDGVYTVVFSGGSFQVLGEGGEYGTASPAEVLSGYTVGRENGVENGTLALTGNVLVDDVLAGKTFYDTDAKVKRTGTMANHGASSITPVTFNQAIPKGYHNGSGIVTGSANLVAANIKSGVNIFGVIGTLADTTSITFTRHTVDVRDNQRYTHKASLAVGKKPIGYVASGGVFFSTSADSSYLGAGSIAGLGTSNSGGLNIQAGSGVVILDFHATLMAGNYYEITYTTRGFGTDNVRISGGRALVYVQWLLV